MGGLQVGTPGLPPAYHSRQCPFWRGASGPLQGPRVVLELTVAALPHVLLRPHSVEGLGWETAGWVTYHASSRLPAMSSVARA